MEQHASQPDARADSPGKHSTASSPACRAVASQGCSAWPGKPQSTSALLGWAPAQCMFPSVRETIYNKREEGRKTAFTS